MRKKILYIVWACLYILCVGLGTLSKPGAFGTAVLVLIALGFFVPGVLLLVDAVKQQDQAGLLRIRVICLCSLVLTAVFLIANILSARASVQTGRVLHDLLQLVSAPMMCGQYWWISLFCWACLLMGSFPRLWKPHTGKKSV